MKHRPYLITGLLYIACSLPAWIMTAAGTLMATGSPHLLLSLFGAPLGVLFLLYAFEKPAPNAKSWIAIRIAGMGLFFIAVMLLALGAFRLGAEPLMTAAKFSVTAASYLSTLALAFLIIGFVKRDPRPDPDRTETIERN